VPDTLSNRRSEELEMPSEDIRLELPLDAHTRTLRITILSDNGLKTFRDALTKMALAQTDQIRFDELLGVTSIRSIRFFLVASNVEPANTVMWMIHGYDVKRDTAGMVIWKRSVDGWRQCLTQAESLSPGTRQTFSLPSDNVAIEAAYPA
jgi:hypothetical protein